MKHRHVVLADRGLVRTAYKKVSTTDELGTRLVSAPDGKEEFYYEVSIDMQRIDAMAFRAAQNKRGVAIRGALQVKVTSRRKVS